MGLGTPLTFSGNQITTGTVAAARIATLDASKIGTGQLALARGGSGADLSATGGSGHVLKQSTSGAVITVAALTDSDIPDALTISGGTINNSVIGGTTPAAATVTTLVANTSLTVANDTDAVGIIGRNRFDSRTTDIAHFSHVDQTATGAYAIRQTAAGVVIVNSVGALTLASSNIGVGYVTSTGFAINTGAAQYGSSAALSVAVVNAAREVIVGRGTTSQTANLLQLETSSSTTKVAAISPSGTLEQWGQSSTTNRQTSAITPVIVTATDASREMGMTLSGVGSGGTFEVIRVTGASAGKLGFFGTAATVKATITGSRGGNAALANLLTELAAKGLITDSTTA